MRLEIDDLFDDEAPARDVVPAVRTREGGEPSRQKKKQRREQTERVADPVATDPNASGSRVRAYRSPTGEWLWVGEQDPSSLAVPGLNSNSSLLVDTQACINLLSGVSFENDQALMKTMVFDKLTEFYATSAVRGAMAGFYAINQYKEAWRLKNVAEEGLRISKGETEEARDELRNEKAARGAEKAKMKAVEDSLQKRVADLEAELAKAKEAEKTAREEAVAQYLESVDYRRALITEAKEFLTKGFDLAKDLAVELLPDADLSLLNFEEYKSRRKAAQKAAAPAPVAPIEAASSQQGDSATPSASRQTVPRTSANDPEDSQTPTSKDRAIDLG